MRGLRRHLSYANVVASLALFFVLGGGAYAAFQFPKNSIDSKQIRASAIGPSEIRAGAVRSTAIANRSILTEHLATKRGGPLPLPSVCPPGQLTIPEIEGGGLQGKIVWRCIDSNPLRDFPPGMVPCPEGTFDPTTQNFFGAHCLPIPGLPADGAENPPDGLPTCPPNALPGTLCLNLEQSIAPGQTVSGVIGSLGRVNSGEHHAYASFPLRAERPISNGDVVIDNANGTGGGDPLNVCVGTWFSPTAPNNTVCVYLTDTPNVPTGSITGDVPRGTTRAGFGVSYRVGGDGNPIPAGIEGTWAYTGIEPDPGGD